MKKIILLILALIAIIPGVVWLKSRIAHPQDNESYPALCACWHCRPRISA
ncbi:MAG: hypothetical protein IPI28_12635 [Candidatus Omnitrophica bacterium]|nr:hypothetical protein [Candidatus Omnitrophota bacterium]